MRATPSGSFCHRRNSSPALFLTSEHSQLMEFRWHAAYLDEQPLDGAHLCRRLFTRAPERSPEEKVVRCSPGTALTTPSASEQFSSTYQMNARWLQEQTGGKENRRDEEIRKKRDSDGGWKFPGALTNLVSLQLRVYPLGCCLPLSVGFNGR